MTKRLAFPDALRALEYDAATGGSILMDLLERDEAALAVVTKIAGKTPPGHAIMPPDHPDHRAAMERLAHSRRTTMQPAPRKVPVVTYAGRP